MNTISRLMTSLALVLVACATSQSVELDPSLISPDAGNPPDAAAVASGGDGGVDTTESGGAPSMGGAPSAGGTGNGGAVASGGVPTQGGAVNGGSGGVLTMSGGAPDNAGGNAGSGGGCTTGQKLCNGACAIETAMNGCSAATCTACPIPAPANGLQVCDAQGQCDFECLSGFQMNGNQCSRSTGGGGTAGGGGGVGGALVCGTRTCKSCIGNLVACCNNSGDGCLCLLHCN